MSQLPLFPDDPELAPELSTREWLQQWMETTDNPREARGLKAMLDADEAKQSGRCTLWEWRQAMHAAIDDIYPVDIDEIPEPQSAQS